MKTKFLLPFIILNLIIKSNPATGNTNIIINTPNEIPAPRSYFTKLIVLNAYHGSLVKINNIHYKLVLSFVDDTAAFYIHSKVIRNDTLSLSLLINILRENKKVEANVTGVQTDKRIGQTQFYATFYLSKPIFISTNHTLNFEAELIAPPINMDQEIFFDNVSVYINGSNLDI